MCRSTLAVLFAVAAIAGCAPAVTPPAVRPPPPSLSEDTYRAARARGETVFRIAPEHSLIVVRAYRGGSLARFGHDHVIASREVYGFVLLAQPASASRADLYIPLDSLSVDEPALRAAAGFDSTPSAGDIEGTTRNMLEKVLHADRFPYVLLRIDRLGGDPPSVTLGAELKIHGVTRLLGIPARLERNGTALRISGELSLRQTDFDLTPYAILGGALRVENRIDLRFQLAGQRW